jgi:hypothetical protein
MFDLNNIDFIKTDPQHGLKSYSFVGLKRKENSERLEFWMPLGFDSFEETFEKSKSFFFRMYRTFQVYRDRKLDQLKEEDLTTDRDGVFEFENGFSFINENKENSVFYGKLLSLDKILKGYDELRISSLEKKLVRSRDIDYSKIHRYLHQAIYLDDDVIYLDEMNIAKNVLMPESPPVVQLFCFIYTEIKKELSELSNVPVKAFELSDKFRDTYLQPDSSLFTENTYSDTINILKNILDEIDNKTTYKDEDFWHFYDAVEAFLNGETVDDKEGIYFGITNFYDIWEDMCQSYMLSNSLYLPKVLFADVNGRLLTRRDLGLFPHLALNPFSLRINNHSRERVLKPDLVISNGSSKKENEIYSYSKLPHLKQNQIAYSVQLIDYNNLRAKYNEIVRMYNQCLTAEDNLKKPGFKFKYMLAGDFKKFQDFVFEVLNNLLSSNITIIDYKYMRISDYENYNPNAITLNKNGEPENKIKEDIHKQLIYEWGVQQNFEKSETQSEFWIPGYTDNLDFETSKQEINITNSYFLPSQIKLFKVNFNILQESYVSLTSSL